MTARTGFDDLVTARSARLRRTAYLVTGDLARADAIVRESLVGTWRQWPTLETDPELHVWAEVVGRVTRRPLRRRVARPEPDGGGLWQRYRHLDSHGRALLALLYVEELPAERVAELLHRPSQTVEHRPADLLARLGTDRDELGALLRDRTADLDALDLAALHEQIDAAGRRRGRTLVAAGAAAAVTVGLLLSPAVLAGDDGTEPPPHRLAGHEIPRTLVSTGFTYEYSEGYESESLDRELTVSLPASEEPRLVAWASSAPRIGAFVTATVDGRWRARQAAGRFEAFELLAPGSPHQVELTQAGVGLTEHLAVAVYSLSEDTPAGVSDGRVTFRDRVLGERLQAGVLGAPGEPEVDVRVEVPSGGARLALTCYGVDGLQVRVALGPLEVGTRSCTRGPERDAGAGGPAWAGPQWVSLLERAGLAPGDPATLRAGLVAADGSGGFIEDGAAVVGVALYTDLVPRTSVAGVDVPTRVELDGHEWQLDGDGYVGPSGEPQATYPVGPADLHRLAAVVVSGGAGAAEPLTWDVLVGSKVVETVRSGDGRTGLTFSPYLVVPQGDHETVEVEVTQGSSPRVRVGFVPFRRVDPLG